MPNLGRLEVLLLLEVVGVNRFLVFREVLDVYLFGVVFTFSY